MKRVTLAMAGASHGGAESFYERLTIALHRRGVPVQAVIRTDAARAARLRDGGVRPVQLPFGGVFDFWTRPGFRRAISGFKPDIVLTFMSRATRFCPRPRSTPPFVHVGRLGGYYDLKYYAACDHLVCNTRDLVDYVVSRGWPRAGVHYVPNFAALRPGEAFPRGRLSTPGDVTVILALGRLHENKAFDVLIDALPELPGVFVWLAGIGPLEDALRGQAERLGVAERIRYLGWTDNPAPYYRAADIVAVPSRHEPLGNVVLEAWAAGKPVVAAASKGPSQLIRDGETGLLTPVDDAEALAGALRRLIEDPALAKRLTEAAMAEYDACFTEAAVVDRYLELFDRIAPEGD